ncbi:8-amino-7-oxononanoate synthase [Vibrio rarus]
MQQALQQRSAQGLTRTVTPIKGGNTHKIYDGKQEYINFSSNDYLGLANDEALKKAWISAIDQYGAGSAASPMVTGQTHAHQRLQDTLCDWLGFEQALLFNSGFSANQAALFTLLQKDDCLLQDKLNHASLMEAGMLSPGKMQRFSHNNPARLQQLLQKHGPSLVVTEGVFSMDGDCAPLGDIATLCQHHGSWLMVDDAHGIGVLGEQGQGSCSVHGITPNLLMVTFGKALGVQGAAILCDSNTAHYLRQFARHFVYSTAMPAAQAVAVTHSVHLARNQQWRRQHLAHLQDVYTQAVAHLPGFVHTQTAIKPYLAGSSTRAMALADFLRQQGLWATAIRPPTVAKDKARIRITLSASHLPHHVLTLAHKLEQFELMNPAKDAS